MTRSVAFAVSALIGVLSLGTVDAAEKSLQKRVTIIETRTPGGVKNCAEGQIPKFLSGRWRCASDVQGGTTTAQLVAVDSIGTAIGPIVDSQFPVSLLGSLAVLEWGGAAYPVPITRTGYFRFVPLFFTTSDCSGTPYTFTEEAFPSFGVFSITAISEPGNSLYAEAGDKTTATIGSQRDSETGQCMSEAPHAEEVYPMQLVVDLDTLFTPPFTVAFQ